MRSERPTAYIKSTGCISNLLDGTSYERMLEEAGYCLVDNVRRAKLVIINTCAFNKVKEDEAIRVIEKAKAAKASDARIVVCGCLPIINSGRLGQIHDDVTFGPTDKTGLAKLLNEETPFVRDISIPISYHQYSPLKKAIFHAKKFVRHIPFLNKLPLVDRLLGSLFIYSDDVCCLKVETGCSGSCTYCAIRFAKGRTASRPLAEIMSDFEHASEKGFRKFVLVGDEITAYGRDWHRGADILDVLNTLIADNRVETLYPESFEPSFMIANFERLLESLSSRKIPVFCSSAQSGSNRILALMNRQYRIEDYISCMKKIREKHPHIYLRNEMIVGFPGETQEEFEESWDLLADLNLDFVDVYEYKDRPNTVASRMSDKVPDDVKRFRRRRLVRQHWKNLLFKRHKRRIPMILFSG